MEVFIATSFLGELIVRQRAASGVTVVVTAFFLAMALPAPTLFAQLFPPAYVQQEQGGNESDKVPEFLQLIQRMRSGDPEVQIAAAGPDPGRRWVGAQEHKRLEESAPTPTAA